MKCVIPGANVKVFGRAIHSLSKIGDELYIEPLEHGLALRTVNSSRSAYSCFTFAPAFFLNYDDGSANINSDDSEESGVRCKIAMKSCLSVFKSLSTLEKTVDKCKITLDMEDARLVFQLYCRHGIVKTYNLAFIECETLQAVFSKDLCPNVLMAQTRLLSEVVVNFQTNQEEISIIVDPQKTYFKNYVEDEPDPSKVIHTELSLDPDEFETYQVGVDTEVTFCLKELRAILGFSEPANLPVSIHFENAGKPIVFSMDTDPSFEANFVLATLGDKSSQVSCSQQSTQVSRPPKQRPQTAAPSSTTKSTEFRSKGDINGNTNRRNKRPSISARLENTYREIAAVEAEGKSLPHDSSNIHSNCGIDPINHNHQPKQSDSTNEQSTHCNKPSHVLPGISHKLSHSKNNTRLSDQKGNNDGRTGLHSERSQTGQREFEPKASTSRGDPEELDSPVLPRVGSTLKLVPAADNTMDRSKVQGLPNDSEEEEDDLIPGTPPSKKFKSMFVGLSQSTVGGSQPSRNRTILAEASDDDDY